MLPMLDALLFVLCRSPTRQLPDMSEHPAGSRQRLGRPEFTSKHCGCPAPLQITAWEKTLGSSEN